jgi:hypothetical protein
MKPIDATHTTEFYGQVLYYKRVEVPYLNQLIDHPEEQWQKLTKWFVYERSSWLDVGPGFSSRRLTPI